MHPDPRNRTMQPVSVSGKITVAEVKKLLKRFHFRQPNIERPSGISPFHRRQTAADVALCMRIRMKA